MPQKGGRRKPQPPRIDFTPMVDLGFLLITFFIFTTTMAKPKTMELNMPATTGDHTPVAEESVITVMPVKGHRIVWYEGMPAESKLKICSNSALRQVLMNKKKQVADLPATFSARAHKLYVVIKPNSDCTYADVVHVLDEMNIVDVPYYSLNDITPEEKEMISKKY